MFVERYVCVASMGMKDVALFSILLNEVRL